MKIAEKIKRIREDNNISREKMAKAIGTTAQHIYQLETGRRSLSLQWIEKISKFFNIKVNDLVSENEINNSESDKIAGYPFKDKYFKYAIYIGDSFINHDLFSKEEKMNILTKIYKVVYEFFEICDGDKIKFTQEFTKPNEKHSAILNIIEELVTEQSEK